MVEPAESAVTWPTLFTVATFGLEDAQVAVVLTSFVVLSENVAVAINWTVVPVVMFAPPVVQPMEPEPQLIAIEVATVLATVSVVVAFKLPEAAVIVVVPRATAVASPLLSMVATVGEDDVQVAVLLMSLVVRSPKVPVAVNCCVVAVPEDEFRAIAGFAGESAMAARSCELMKNFPQLSAAPNSTSAAVAPTTCAKRLGMRATTEKSIKPAMKTAAQAPAFPAY